MKYALYILTHGTWSLLVEGSGNDVEVIRSARKVADQGYRVRALRGNTLLISL